jgi:hypothetical protein
VRRDVTTRVERGDGGRRGQRFARAAPRVGVRDLPMQIAPLDDVGVREGQCADARGGEVQARGRAEATHAHHERARVRQRRLLRRTEGGQRDVPGVALEVRAAQRVAGARALPRAQIGRQGHRRVVRRGPKRSRRGRAGVGAKRGVLRAERGNLRAERVHRRLHGAARTDRFGGTKKRRLGTRRLTRRREKGRLEKTKTTDRFFM